MSRIGKLPITIPKGVTVTVKESTVTVKGAKGELSRSFNPELGITVEGDKVTVSRPNDEQKYRALHGLTRTLVSNMVEGVSKGFEKGLEIVGAGYRVEKTGDKLVLRVGFSHRGEVNPVPGITYAIDGTTKIKVQGIDKELVGEVAANIRKIKRADSYKGKGLRYSNEVIRLKAGKAVGKRKA